MLECVFLMVFYAAFRKSNSSSPPTLCITYTQTRRYLWELGGEVYILFPFSGFFSYFLNWIQVLSPWDIGDTIDQKDIRWWVEHSFQEAPYDQEKRCKNKELCARKFVLKWRCVQSAVGIQWRNVMWGRERGAGISDKFCRGCFEGWIRVWHVRK